MALKHTDGEPPKDMSAVQGQKYVLDPDGDVLITLKNPNVPSPVSIAWPLDAGEASPCPRLSPTEDVCYLASPEALSASSLYF